MQPQEYLERFGREDTNPKWRNKRKPIRYRFWKQINLVMARIGKTYIKLQNG